MKTCLYTHSNRNRITEQLNRILQMESALYQNTRDAHWNITGYDLREAPEFFNRQFLELAVIIDDIMECMQQFGIQANDLIDVMHSADEGDPLLADGSNGYFYKLISRHELAIKCLKNFFMLIPENFAAFGSFVSKAITSHRKLADMIRSRIKSTSYSTENESSLSEENMQMLFV